MHSVKIRSRLFGFFQKKQSLILAAVFRKIFMVVSVCRFKSKLVRRLASGTFIARNVFIMGITMYTPCVALNTVASIPYWASYLLMTALGILFTVFGNLKSAITADVIQGLV